MGRPAAADLEDDQIDRRQRSFIIRIGILNTGKTQRQVAVEAAIPEGRLSELVTGKARPTENERGKLNQVLGADFFAADARVDLFPDPIVMRGRRR